MFYKLKSFVAFFIFSLFHLIIQVILSVELQRRLKGKQFLCFTIYDKVLSFIFFVFGGNVTKSCQANYWSIEELNDTS